MVGGPNLEFFFTKKQEISIGKGAMLLKCHFPRVADH